ncbi:hypothetical protein F511_03381 [Dorcoceras hygrometricum]|uniref:Protein SCAR n=1 Tax=Dorcoceras hygrometricum TaxID=472368 RepID=A0A2Z7BG67_9LAMI|nr:hypothetical protein F511_03381 [Dorcoceras hygrometricum]
MPITRYEIRSEYSLADPQLYTAADKDDPEALLEGVAMSGFVGLLRQLGDLSEFAAVVFHELHDEVMVTATRGDSLLSRVQQLEADFASIEKAFLSQTDHSSFMYNAGLDWHPNLQTNHNIVTKGNLPRFMMDSYEESRGPPRLFLLDKFDTAGAGACLKRYTDPSFFKIEISSFKMNGRNIQREKKIRKAKRKETYWKNAGTPEDLPSSHAKLHQLFMEDHDGNGDSSLACSTKLKRRLNGFPLDLKTGQSYMEKLLKSPSPEHKVLHEITMNSSSLSTLRTTEHDDSRFGVLQFGMNADRDPVERKRSPPSPQREDIMLKPSVYKQNEVSSCKILKEDNSYPSIIEDSATYSCDRITSETDMAVDVETKAAENLIGYLTDDFASEIDNFVDGPVAIESELDTDSELREKTEITSYVNRQLPTYDLIATVEQHIHSTDSRTTGKSMLSDDENHSSGKEISSFSILNFPNSSVDSTKSEHYAAACTTEIEIIDAPFSQKTAGGDFPMAHPTKSAVYDDTCSGTFAVTNHCLEFVQQNPNKNLTGLDPTLEVSDSEYISGEIVLRAPELAEKLDVEYNKVKTNPSTDASSSPSFSDFNLQSEHNSLLSSSGAHVVHGSKEGIATCTNSCLAAGCPVTVSFDFVQVDRLDQEDLSGPECNEKLSHASSEAKKEKLAIDPGCSCSDSDSKTQFGGNSPSSSVRSITFQRSNGESGSCSSTISDNSCDATIVAISSDTQHTDKSSQEDLHLGNDLVLLLNNRARRPPKKDKVIQMFSTDNLDNDESNDGDLEFSENCRFDSHNLAHDKHSFMSALPKEENSIDESDNVALNAFANASSDFSSIKEASLGEELEKTFLGSAQTVDVEEQGCNRSVHNQICSPYITISHIKCSQDWPGTGLDTHDIEVGNLGEEKTVNESLAVETLVSCEHLGLKVTGITDDAPSHDLTAVESLYYKDKNFVGPNGATDIVEKSGNTSCRSSCSQEATNSAASPELTPLNNNNNVLLGEPNLQTDVSGIAGVLSVADNVVQDGVHSPLGFYQLVEDGIPCFEDSNSDKLENGKTCLLESQGQSGLVDEVSQRHVAPSDLNRVFYDTITHNPPKSEESDTVVNLDFSSIVNEHGMDLFNTATTQFFSEPIKLDLEQTLCQQRNLLYHNECFHNIVQTTPQEHASVLPTQLSHECMDSGGIDTGFTCEHMLELHDHQAASNSPSNCSLFSFPDQPLMTALPAPNNNEVDVCKHSDHSLGSMLQPGNCFWMQIQSVWRENQQEEFSQGTSTTSTFTQDVSSLDGELNGSLVLSSHGTISNKDKVGHSHLIQEIVGLSSNTENEKQEVTISSSEKFALTYVEDVVQSGLDNSSSKKKIEHSTTNLDSSVLTHETIDHKPKIENVKQDLIVPSSVIEFASRDVEGGNSHESRTGKLPQPRNSLFDSVSALDKSKLRKVAPRIKAEIQKVGERDSLLEQIRTKSFNLKPALATKPSVRGPKTNLKVVAILEKANSIRQALAGSDEDDEDSWSDS